ncbi:MAG: hypothetical protein PHQ04_00835 [Opitutaceae bacterium]|nr:hypothetical protein [Opitutaceae bacterium]
MPRLSEAHSRLDAKDLPAAMAIYKEVLAAAGDRADVLVTISGDLGVHGHVNEIIDLIGFRYDAQRHGPATGLNLLQAYIAGRHVEAAQHLLDVLFSLGRPELEERLFGFSNAIGELMAGVGAMAESAPLPAVANKKINLVSISNPIWFYGLEEVTPPLLPQKEGRRRRVAFVQLSQPGERNPAERPDQAEEEMGRLSRAFPLWLAETFTFSAGYESIAVLGLWENEGYALLGPEWAVENIRQLNDSNERSLDYVVTGYLRQLHADYELCLRIWELRKFRELKALTTRWTPGTADETLRAFHEQVRTYMEWTALPACHGLPYAAPTTPLAHLGALDGSASLFLADKGVLPRGQSHLALTPFGQAVTAMPDAIVPRLALVTALLRARRLGESIDSETRQQAQTWLDSEAAKTLGVSGLVI